MQRRHLTTVLASLGLSACEPERGQLVEPEPSGSEPSGLGHAAKPELSQPPTPNNPHFDGVPTQFCNADVQPRNQPLLRTHSLLEAWNELAPTIRNPNAFNIPVTEIDARFALCGAEQCSIHDAKLSEVVADYMVGAGVLIPSDTGLLVLPDIAAQHVVGECTLETKIQVEYHGRFVHVRAHNVERRYSYGHGGPGYGYGYEHIPMACNTYSTQRRDLVIDMDEGELELVIDQTRASEDPATWVELAFDGSNIVLSGCASTLALQWTG